MSPASWPGSTSPHGHHGTSNMNHSQDVTSRVPMSTGMGPAPQSSGSSSGGSSEDIPSALPPKELAGSIQQEIFLDYSTYMARFVPAQAGGSPEQSPSHGALSSPTKVSGMSPALGAGHGQRLTDPVCSHFQSCGSSPSRAMVLGSTQPVGSPGSWGHPAPRAGDSCPPTAR